MKLIWNDYPLWALTLRNRIHTYQDLKFSTTNISPSIEFTDERLYDYCLHMQDHTYHTIKNQACKCDLTNSSVHTMRFRRFLLIVRWIRRCIAQCKWGLLGYSQFWGKFPVPFFQISVNFHSMVVGVLSYKCSRC